jgi:hypothetical protein
MDLSGGPQLWDVRPDGTRYPNSRLSDAVLGMESESSETGLGFEYNRTLGDLILDVLLPTTLAVDQREHPENWESAEHAFLIASARELRACIVAAEHSETNDYEVVFSEEDARLALGGIAARMEAGAELLRRMRSARWGNPHFGGGEPAAAAKLAIDKAGAE